MAICLGKSFSFGLPFVYVVHDYQFLCVRFFPFGFEGGIWDIIVLVPDRCLSFHFNSLCKVKTEPMIGNSCIQISCSAPDTKKWNGIYLKGLDFVLYS